MAATAAGEGLKLAVGACGKVDRETPLDAPMLLLQSPAGRFACCWGATGRKLHHQTAGNLCASTVQLMDNVQKQQAVVSRLCVAQCVQTMYSRRQAAANCVHLFSALQSVQTAPHSVVWQVLHCNWHCAGEMTQPMLTSRCQGSGVAVVCTAASAAR